MTHNTQVVDKEVKIVPNEPVEAIRVTEEGRNPTWKSKTHGEILIRDMENDHLQKAYLYAQSREYDLLLKMNIFTDLIKHLEEEADKRGLKLQDLYELDKTSRKRKLKEFTLRNRALKKATTKTDK